MAEVPAHHAVGGPTVTDNQEGSAVRTYRRKHAAIEAVQVTQENVGEIVAWLSRTNLAVGPQVTPSGSVWWSDNHDIAYYATNHEAEPGAWIVRLDDCFQRLDAEVFAERYEPA